MNQTIQIPTEFFELLPAFKKKLVDKSITDFHVQTWFKNADGSYKKKEPDWIAQHRAPNDNDFAEHFFINPTCGKNADYGSIGLRGPGREGKAKYCIIDADTLDLSNILLNKVIPEFESYKVEYMIGHSGEGRMHLVFLCEDIPIPILKEFIDGIFYTVGTSRRDFDEVYPAYLPNGNCRMEGGPHIKRGQRYPITFRGEDYINPLDIMKAYIDCIPISLERMQEINSQFTVKTPERKTTRKLKSYFYYKNLNLKLPIDNIPGPLKKVVRNCQAINGALEDVVKNEGLEERGMTTHMRGLFLHGISEYADRKFKSEQGKEFIDYLVQNYRFRDPSTHNWDNKKDSIQVDQLFPRCEKWEEYLDKCQGCPFRGRVHSPKQFIFGKELKREAIRNISLKTPEQIRKTTFQRFKQRVHYLIDYGRREHMLPANLLLASNQGVGKSFMCFNELVPELLKKNKRILISVPSGKLALEVKAWLETKGITPFLLMSHMNIFGHQAIPRRGVSLANYDCPSYDEIQKGVDLGLASGALKNEHCKACPLFEKCHYPNQYTQVMEDKYKVVIIQHAHFSCQEVIFNLMQKEFDVLFVDESFIENCYASVEIKRYEWECLNHYDYEWTKRLSDWLQGNQKPYSKINPPKGQLEELQRLFKGMNAKWTIPDYIRYYNQGRTVCKETGIEIVYELPDIPIRIFTDATPPIELTKAVTGIKNLEVIGKDELIDIKKIHPDNEIIQVLDTSASLTSLEKDDRLEEILSIIGYMVQYKLTSGEKILLTIYSKHYDRVVQYFKYHEQYKDVLNRITINWMDKGTNAYADYDVQFLLAAVYFLGKDYLINTYKYVTVANYYKRKNGEAEIPNIYPTEMEFATRVETIDEMPVTRIEQLGDKGIVFEYPNMFIKSTVPERKWHRLIYELNIATMQQAIRLRFTKEKARKVYIFNNSFLPSTIVTKSVLEDELLNVL